MFLLWLRQLAWCGDQTPASVPPPTEGTSSPTNTPVFPPSSFLLSFACFYKFFSAGHVLLSTLSWCSACTSVSEGIFLMYLWREMYSTSTYSSASCFFRDEIFSERRWWDNETHWKWTVCWTLIDDRLRVKCANVKLRVRVLAALIERTCLLPLEEDNDHNWTDTLNRTYLWG